MEQEFKKIYLIGYSGHGRVLVDAAISQGILVEGYFQDNISEKNPFLLEYKGKESNLSKTFYLKSKFIIGVGDNKKRFKIFKAIKNRKGNVQTIIHPSADISSFSEIGEGCFLNKLSVNS